MPSVANFVAVKFVKVNVGVSDTGVYVPASVNAPITAPPNLVPAVTIAAASEVPTTAVTLNVPTVIAPEPSKLATVMLCAPTAKPAGTLNVTFVLLTLV